ncbi:MAG: hypothetical protein DCC52_17715, partial [Chloroflexi bacterium]
EILDARGKLVMPGNICAHTHFYGAFARGMALPPGPPPKNFPEILQKLWWRIDRALTLEDSKYSALVCLVDAIKHGTTTLIDHHASPNAIDGSLDAIADAVNESGLRACLCYEVTDRNGVGGANAGIRAPCYSRPNTCYLWPSRLVHGFGCDIGKMFDGTRWTRRGVSCSRRRRYFG